MSVQRIYVEKKTPYAVEASSCCGRFAIFCKLRGVTGLRLLNRYDVEGVADELFAAACLLCSLSRSWTHMMQRCPPTRM